ncbi:MAG: tyrosine-type recombinase/integrase [Litorilinea sp.]
MAPVEDLQTEMLEAATEATPAPGMIPATPPGDTVAQATAGQETAGQETDAHDAPELAPPLRADSSLESAVAAFKEYMTRKGFRENSIKAFLNDLKILMEFAGPTTRLLNIQTATLNEFLDWLQRGRDYPDGKKVECKPKTLARRITTLKSFFSWLHGIGIIGTDPAEPIVQISVRTPLPTILNDGDLGKLQNAVQDYLFDRKRPDARPYLLFNLLLQTGMKKAECAALLIEDIDVSNPQSPTVNIRYEDDTQKHKNRTLPLHPGIIPALNQYLQQYKPENILFPCTPRNLEYVLDDVGKRAGIKRVQVGFETLRWTAAVRDFRMGVPEEQLRQKMGLTKISWRDTGDKIQQLTGRV